jgi:hypothetical protein
VVLRQRRVSPGLAPLDDAAAQLSKVMPESRRFATARLRGVAYGINGENERAGDDGPFDWRTGGYARRDD